MPRATDYIAEQIDMVKKLERLGFTYEIPESGIYYDTEKFPEYGALSGQDMSKQKGGIRIDVEGKKSPNDFLLWAFSPKDKKRDMEWDSPWGKGWPGWHIECSAMSLKLLGEHFDLHTGGQEHINIHHTNEIAQSEPIVGKPWVNYWVHFAWLMAKDGKMSKSAGDSLTVSYIKERGYDPMHFRYMMLLGHYRQPMDFSFASLDAAKTGYERIVRKIAELQPDGPADSKKFDEWRDKMLAAMNDNLKSAETLVVFQEMLRDAKTDAATKLAVVEFADDLLGLRLLESAKKIGSGDAPDGIKALADQRARAKAARDFAAADRIRGEIEAAGWLVTDTKDGFSIAKK
jgi:cysteinyl-tRNA synthetase